MKRLLNTLYVTTQGAYLCKDGESVCVRIEDQIRLRAPVHTLGGVVGFGQVSASPALLHHLAENDVAVSFLSETGKFLAQVRGPVSGNVVLRREQHRWADDPARTASIARAILLGKLGNARTVIRRRLRDHPDWPGAEALESAALQCASMIEQVRLTDDLDALRGLEGDAAHAYFHAFPGMISPRAQGFVFAGRNRRPPTDAVNCLLSFLYTLLAHDVRSALETVGLDPQIGFLHRDRSGRPGLALDLMEEFRPWLADRVALSLINSGELKAKDFETSAAGAVSMKDDARRTLLVAWQKRKQEEIEHPFLKETMSIALLPHVQANLLARRLRGDLDDYPPFFWR